MCFEKRATPSAGISRIRFIGLVKETLLPLSLLRHPGEHGQYGDGIANWQVKM